MFKTKYRIVTTQEGRFQIEYRYWWFPIWYKYTYRAYCTLGLAQQALNTITAAEAFKPKVVHRAP